MTPTDRPTVIVEPNPGGHRLSYVALLAEHCAAESRRVIVVTTNAALESAAWHVHLDGIEVEPLVLGLSEFTLTHLAQLSQKTDAELTIIPDGDRLLTGLAVHGWRRSGGLSLLIMRPDAQGRRGLARAIKSLAKKGLMSIAGARANVRVYGLRSPIVRRRGFVRWIADPVSYQPDAAYAARLARDLRSSALHWFGVFGAVTARKNLDLIALALVGLDSVGLLVAGTIDEEAWARAEPAVAKFKEAGGVFRYIEGRQTNEQFDSALEAVDCVVAAHTNEGPSGLVSKAAFAGKRLVLAGADSLRRDATVLGDQSEWSDLSVEGLHTAFVRTLRGSDARARFEFGDGEFAKELASR